MYVNVVVITLGNKHPFLLLSYGILPGEDISSQHAGGLESYKCLPPSQSIQVLTIREVV